MNSIITVPRNLYFKGIHHPSRIFLSSSSSIYHFSTATTSTSSSSSPSPTTVVNTAKSNPTTNNNPDIRTLQKFVVEPLPRAFARPQSAAGRLVSQISERRSDRLRYKAADILLDKETSLYRGVITPGIPTISKDNQDTNTENTKTKQYVGLESLGRIERSMSLGKSSGAKAGIRSLITRKTMEINALDNQHTPITKLISIIRNAESLGIPLRLRRKEYELVKEYERENFRNNQSSTPSMKIPAVPFDLTSTKLSSLSNEGKQLRNTLQSTDNRATLLQIAKSRK